MMLRPSVMKSREVQVMLGTVMRSSSLGLSTCHTLMSSSEHVANNSDVPLVEDQIKELSLLRLMCSLCYHTHTHSHTHTANRVSVYRPLVRKMKHYCRALNFSGLIVGATQTQVTSLNALIYSSAEKSSSI